MAAHTPDLHEHEARMVARHSDMYALLEAMQHTNHADLAKLDRDISSFNRDLARYNRAVATESTACLERMGGITELLQCAQPAAPSTSPLGEQLTGSIDYFQKPGSSDNRRGAQLHAHHISHLVSTEEAGHLCNIANELGFRAVIPEIPTNLVQKLPKRTHKLCVLHSPELGSWLWERVRQCVPSVVPEDMQDREDRWTPVGINPCFRFNRYERGQEFSTHADDVFISRDAVERTFLTVLVYLNHGFGGGQTVFMKSRSGPAILGVEPCTGDALVFQHDMLHEATKPSGEPCKMIMRTDVMFRRGSARSSARR